jgi:predicted  nucleic acid-binding Zn-ribbon protein
VISGVDPRTFVNLVLHDRQIHELRQNISAGKRRRRELELLLQEYATARNQSKGKLDEVQFEIRRLEREIEDHKRQAKTHSSRLNEISDTREYRALNDEVRYLTRKVGDSEEAILEHMETAEKQGAEYEKAQSELDAKTAEINDEIRQIESDGSERKLKLSDAEKTRDQLLESLPPAAQALYVRRSKRIQMPIVWIRDGACGYCHHKLTPQTAIEVLNGKTLFECESCGRHIVNVDQNGAESIQGAP